MIKSITQSIMSCPFDTITISLAFCGIVIIGFYQYLSIPKKIPIIRIKTSPQEEDYEFNIIDSENGPIWF